MREADSDQALKHLAYWQGALPGTCFVYVIRAGRDGPIKIGKANRPLERMAELQTGNPFRLRLWQVLPGGLELEKRLQDTLRDQRLTGEWFEGPDIEAFLVFLERLTERLVDESKQTEHGPDYSRISLDFRANPQRGAEHLEQIARISEIAKEKARDRQERYRRHHKREWDAMMAVPVFSPHKSS
jgi:hypothetical protein